MTKPTKWVCAQWRFRSAWASTQSDQSLRCPLEWTLDEPWVLSYPLSGQRRLIRLGGCPGWSESSLGAHATMLCPATRKWRGIMLYPPKFWVSVRPSVCLSVRPSVRPSAPTTILVSATPPTVLGQSFWNFTGVLRMVWRYAYCFFRILKLFFITFFPFLT